MQVLEATGGVKPNARYVVMDTADGWYESIDMFEVVHPQTILAYGLNGEDLPVGNGAPLRLRVERQCGYKNVKFLKSIQVVESLAGLRKRLLWASAPTMGFTGSLVSRRRVSADRRGIRPHAPTPPPRDRVGPHEIYRRAWCRWDRYGLTMPRDTGLQRARQP